MPATLADIQKKYGDGIYPLYKDQMHEPYMEYPSGHGYMGAVIYDENIDRLQCGICGNWYKNIGSHAFFQHKLSKNEYKKEMGLNLSTPLVPPSTSSILSMNAKGRKFGKKRNRNYMKNMSVLAKTNTTGKKKSVQYRNKYGSCEAQIEARLNVLISQCGKSPTRADFDKFDPNLRSILKWKYGTINKAKEVFGLSIIKRKSFPTSDIELIAKLRNFVLEHKKMPLTTDFSGGARKSFDKYFGSWRRAKMMAGLDQLLNEMRYKEQQKSKLGV